VSLHPDSARVLELTAQWEAPDELTVKFARQTEVRRHRELDARSEDVDSVRHVAIPTGDGSIPAIVYTPAGAQPDGVLVHVHGGGWTIGSPELCAPEARALANAGNCVVISVGYRLAPEHRYPDGLDDVYAATCWAAEHAAHLGAPPGTVVVGGASSGGNMAAAVCLMARDREGPPLAGQLLIYPATARDVETVSRRELAEGHGLTVDTLMWCWDHYLGPDADATVPYVSPLLAPDLSGLPRAIVLTAGCDILRDEGEAYGRRLREADVHVIARRFDGMLHGFLGYAGVVAAARSALAWIGDELRQLLADATSTRSLDSR
jgi:acetyl esterase